MADYCPENWEPNSKGKERLRRLRLGTSAHYCARKPGHKGDHKCCCKARKKNSK